MTALRGFPPSGAEH